MPLPDVDVLLCLDRLLSRSGAAGHLRESAIAQSQHPSSQRSLLSSGVAGSAAFF